MKTTLSLALAAALVLTVLGEMSAYAANTKAAPAPTAQVESTMPEAASSELRKNAFSLELLGRGFLYSFNYDRLVTDNVAVGVGVSRYSIGSGDASAGAVIVPIYSNYYFGQGNGRFFATGGANLIFAKAGVGDDKVSGSGVAGVLGGGWEYRADNGFLFRASPYLFVGKASGAWLGLSAGFSI